MTDLLATMLGRYSLRARVYPALIALIPALSIAVLTYGRYPWPSLLGLATGTGAVFLGASVVRTLGRRVESRLIVRWGGLPTTQLLRTTSLESPSLLATRRSALQAVTGVELPTPEFEAANPTAADREYVAATRRLILIVQQRSRHFPRVQDENINYGFIRNLLGVKPIALTLLLACSVVDVVAGRVFQSPFALAATVGVNSVLALIWLFYVTPNRVLEAGRIYAERLFECMATPSVLVSEPR